VVIEPGVIGAQHDRDINVPACRKSEIAELRLADPDTHCAVVEPPTPLFTVDEPLPRLSARKVQGSFGNPVG